MNRSFVLLQPEGTGFYRLGPVLGKGWDRENRLRSGFSGLGQKTRPSRTCKHYSCVSSVKLLEYLMTCIYMRTHSSILRCAPWPLGLHLLKIQLLGELPFSVPPYEIKLLIFWQSLS